MTKTISPPSCKSRFSELTLARCGFALVALVAIAAAAAPAWWLAVASERPGESCERHACGCGPETLPGDCCCARSRVAGVPRLASCRTPPEAPAAPVVPLRLALGASAPLLPTPSVSGRPGKVLPSPPRSLLPDLPDPVPRLDS